MFGFFIPTIPMTHLPHHLAPHEHVTPALINAVLGELHRLSNVAAAPPVRVSKNAAGIEIGLSRELPQFDLIELSDAISPGDKDQTVKQLCYRPTDDPPALFGVGPDEHDLQRTADPQQGLFLKGERHLAYFHPGAGQRIPLPGVLFHLGKTTAVIAPADPAHPELVRSGPADVWQYDKVHDDYVTSGKSVTVYDWFGRGIDSGTIVYLFQHNQSRRWYAIPQAQTTGPQPVRWGICQANWTYTGGVYPSQGGHARVTVKECDDSVGTNPHGDNIVVYLPKNASGDPNLVAGDVLAFVLATNGTPVCVSSYMDDPIGTVKMFTGNSGQVRPGWACMGGGNESKHLNGNSWNMEGKFARHSCSDGLVGTTGGSDTHNHGGVTGYNETGITVNDHPPHKHATPAEYTRVKSGDDSVNVLTAPANSCTSTEKYNSGDGSCGIDTTLSHTVVDEGHAHTLSADSNVPAYRYLRFIERVDNSG